MGRFTYDYIHIGGASLLQPDSTNQSAKALSGRDHQGSTLNSFRAEACLFTLAPGFLAFGLQCLHQHLGCSLYLVQRCWGSGLTVVCMLAPQALWHSGSLSDCSAFMITRANAPAPSSILSRLYLGACPLCLWSPLTTTLVTWFMWAHSLSWLASLPALSSNPCFSPCSWEDLRPALGESSVTLDRCLTLKVVVSLMLLGSQARCYRQVAWEPSVGRRHYLVPKQSLRN